MLSIKKIIWLIALPIIITLWWLSSTSTTGPDYLNYIWMIDRIQATDYFISKLLIAKDIMFGLIVWIVNPQNRDNYSDVFYYIFAIIAIHRFFLAQKMGFKFILYSLCYYILLSPGLDFAALRSLMGLSFIVIYLCCNRFKVLFFTLAFFSHIAMIIPIIFFSKTFENIYNKIGVLKISFLLYILAVICCQLMFLFPQTEVYIDLEGSWLLFFRILFLYFSLLFLYIVVNLYKLDIFVQTLIRSSIFLSIFALGCINVSVVASRIMEMSAFFSLIALFSIPFNQLKKNLLLISYSLTFLIIALSFLYRNMQSNLWYLIF